jgi:hypothetical protein
MLTTLKRAVVTLLMFSPITALTKRRIDLTVRRVLKTFLPAIVTCAALAAENPALTSVPANPKAPGVAAPNVLSPELMELISAQGSMKVENPTALANFYGYDNDGPMIPTPGNLPSAVNKVEATKTEPDKNTYLVLPRQHGADATYNYGSHFLYQGHENGVSGQGYITRINLDADVAHRVTVLATKESSGATLPVLDGSTWYPFSSRLLFSAENGTTGGIWQATADYPSNVENLRSIMGIAAYEGIQADNLGRIILVEDASGSKGVVNSHARRPNSFVYHFIPANAADLKQGGKLQALQVMSLRHSGSIRFGASADADIKSDDVKDLHTYGLKFATNWITIHDTATDGFVSFDANALRGRASPNSSSTKLATPMLRPKRGRSMADSDRSCVCR